MDRRGGRPPATLNDEKRTERSFRSNRRRRTTVTRMNSTIEHMQPSASQTVPFAEWSDEDLMLAYRNDGERRAFETLVHRYERELFNYLRRYLGDAEMAEDAFQGTFLQVHLKCEHFEPGRKVRPWLYTVATNQAIDAKRRNRRHQAASLDRCCRAGEQDDEGGSLMEFLGSEEPGPGRSHRIGRNGGTGPRGREQFARVAQGSPDAGLLPGPQIPRSGRGPRDSRRNGEESLARGDPKTGTLLDPSRYCRTWLKKHKSNC